MRSRSLLNELFSYCRSESLSEDGLGEIIERHRLTTQNLSSFRLGRYKFFHAACNNDRVNEEIIRYLLEYFPTAASATNDDNGCLPLHYACQNPNMTLNIIQLLIDAAPASVRCQDNQGRMPLHCLCGSKAIKANEADELEVLKLLIGKHPEAVRRATNNNNGCLPIHIAGKWRSLEFCRVLIEAYPGSERITDPAGKLPLYYACICNTFATVEYLYKLHPDAINVANARGYPIDFAIAGLKIRDSPMTAVNVVKLLLECNSKMALQELNGRSLLLRACLKKYDKSNLHLNAALEIIKVICDACPESLRKENNNGCLPLHIAARDSALEIVKLLLEKYPEAVRHANNKGILPIHAAASGSTSPELCCMLIEAYPGSERMPARVGALPLHIACAKNTVATVEYLYTLYPDAINHTTSYGYPIHFAITGIMYRNNPAGSAEIVEFLLGCDPTVKLQKFQGESLLYFACNLAYNDSNIEAGIQVIKGIYDAYPEAIEDNNIASNIHRYHQQVQAFINNELVYARQAKDLRQMMTPDGNGQLPLHTALQNNVRLGSIKLLVKGNPSAIRNVDANNFAFPLHVACQHHDSTTVLQYLIGLDIRTLGTVDYDNNTVLHYACRGAKHDTIALLLEKYEAVSVSKRNAQNKLPIDILFESSDVLDRDSVEYTDSVFRLLKAYPETIMNCSMNMIQPADTYANQNGKKRKLDAVEVNGAMNIA